MGPTEIWSWLPYANSIEYGKGRLLYGHGQPAEHVYFVVSGMVLVRVSSLDEPVVSAIHQRGHFFGMDALVNFTRGREEAVVWQNAVLRSWPARAIQTAILEHPKFGVVLMATQVQRCVDLQARLNSFFSGNVQYRLAQALLDLASQLGTDQIDGSIQMPPITQDMLAEYVGTARSVTTRYLNAFRQGVTSTIRARL